MVKSSVLLIALCTVLQGITPPAMAQSFANCQHSRHQAARPVGDSPATWATLLYRLRKVMRESSGFLSNLKREDRGISIFYLDPSNGAQIRIEIVGSTAHGLVAADCWNDRLKEITIEMYHVSNNERLTWQDLENPVFGHAAFGALALLAARYLLPNQLALLDSWEGYLENIRTRARVINAKTAYLSLGITDDFRLFSTEYDRGELIFWVYYRQKILDQAQ